MTACYGREQALIANALKASYLAPYLGRMSDAGLDGAAECQRIPGCLRWMPVADAIARRVAAVRVDGF